MATKEKKKGSIQTVSIESLATSFRETGCVPLDLALTNGKGIPEGGSILFYATSGCGKTTIYADMCKNLIERALEKGENYRIVYVDVEGSKELLLSMGLGPYIASGNLIIKTGAITFNQLEDIYEKVLGWYEDPSNSKNDEEYKDVKIIIVDSLNMVQSQALMEKAVDDGDFGSNAKERMRFYPKYFTRCKGAGVTNMYITQIRQALNAAAFAEQTKAAISGSDKFYFDIVMKGAKSERAATDMEKVKVNTAFGVTEIQNRCAVTLKTDKGEWVKNRYGHLPEVTLLLEYGKRVVSSYTIREMLCGYGLVEKGSSGYFKLTPELIEALGLTDYDPTKNYRKRDVNIVVTQNLQNILNFLKANNMYKLIDENIDIYDDGL